ncbi:hypothetical protein [Pseudarthrobacter oxydans]|uniref:hypothetical protein n=1 Tax=Pseudarthrobacter oxydans TaxID=1671 RepID=UPI00344BF07C
MTTTTFKMPELVSDFWILAEKLGMKGSDLISELDRVFGLDRWAKDGTDLSFSVTTLGVQDDGEVIAPAGYALAEGVTDVYVGAETVSSAFNIRPSWHAATGLFSIEVTPADGTGEFQTLATEEALKLATDLKAVTESIRPVNITAAVVAA